MPRRMLQMIAEPIVPPWTSENDCDVNGAELQRAILRGFSEHNPRVDEEFTFEKVFTAKEHGEFFRGAMTMAGLRYAGDFVDLLQRYGMIKVTITKYLKEESHGILD